MVEFRDCTGRLAATGDVITGLVENRYKGQKTKAQLRIGESLTIERENVITIITRISATEFNVESRLFAA